MSKIEFYPETQSFNLSNAYFLAKLADLVYQPLDKIKSILESEYGLIKYKPFEVQDTQAFLAANDKVVVLVFRGTTSGADWITNVKFVLVPDKVGKVHYGFKEALDLVWEDIYDTAMSWKGKDQAFCVTGHSLGGALATLAADRFTEENVELVSNLYTFGQPRIGEKIFAENFDRKIKRYAFRFVDDQDIVTKVPFPPGYKHIGNEYFLDNKGVIHKDGTFASWFRSSSEGVYLRSVNVDGGIRYKADNPGGIRDHGSEYYVKYLYQNLQLKGKSPFLDYINGIS